MAKKYTEYEEYLKKAQADAAQKQQDYAETRNQSAYGAITALNKQTADEQLRIENQHQKAMRDTSQAYRSMFHNNAVNERVARMNVEETMANMGLTDSGLNRTQQTAISSVRARADYETAVARRAAIDSLMTELNNALAKNQQTRLNEAQAILTSAREDVAKNAQTLDKAAVDSAKTAFSADLERAQAEQDAEIAQQEMALDREEMALKSELEREEMALKKELEYAQMQLAREKQASQLSMEQQKLESTLAKNQSATASDLAATKHKTLSAMNTLIRNRSLLYEAGLREDYETLLSYYLEILGS